MNSDQVQTASAGSPRSTIMEILFFVGMVVVWFALQMWILPSMGVPT